MTPVVHHPIRGRRLAAIATALLPLLASCKEENTYVPPPPPKVTVAAPAQRPVTRYLEMPGNAAAVNTVNLVARVPGYLQQIQYRDGQVVTHGAQLFLIEQDQYQAALSQAQGAVAAAQAKLTHAEVELARQSTLGRQDFASQSVVDTATANRDEARAELQQAQANLQVAQINLSYTQVTAPFDGVVGARQVSQGQLVGQGSPTTLANIVQLNPIWVTFNISEVELERIRQEMARRNITLAQVGAVEVEAALQANQGFPHRGRLDYVSPTVDSATGTLMLRAVFDNPDTSLMPGNFLRVRLPVGRDIPSLLVPQTAVGADQAGRYVLVVGADNVVEQRRVTLGPLADDGLQVIEQGLKPEDKVVVDGVLRAVPGQRVDPQVAPPPASPRPAAAAR